MNVVLKPRQWSLFAAALVTASAALAQQPTALSAEDKSAIQSLATNYAKALGECRAQDFANLFTPDGAFVAGFRGHMVGRKRLVELVESERHCLAPARSGPAARPGGAGGPTVAIEATASGARGVADLGIGEYHDEYTKTADGWRIASRTVIMAAEKAAGLDSASEFLAIERLGGSALGDYYEPDQNGMKRLLTSGVRVNVKDGVVTGRAFLKDGSHNDEVYEKLEPGQWRVKSSVHVPGDAR
jgi:hypothetical protein